MKAGRAPLWLLCAALLAAALLRGLHLADLAREQGGEILFVHPVVDAEEYDLAAQRYARGETWQVPVHGPLYPLLLGGFYAGFGRDLDAVRWMQLGLGLAAIAILFALARDWIGDLPAGLASLLLALYRPALLFNAELYSEGLAVFLLLLALLALQCALRSGGWFSAALLGVTLGALALTRTNLALLLPLGALAVLVLGAARLGVRVRNAIVAGAFGVLPILLVARANHAVSGEWVWIQAQGGLALYMANHPGSDGTPDIRPGPEFDALRREPRRVAGAAGPTAESAYWSARVRDFAWSEQLAFLGLLARKAWHVLSPVEVPSSYQPEAQRDASSVARLPLPGFETLFPLALAGIVAGSWRARSRTIWLALGAVIAASLIFGFAAGRYRYQLAPLLALAAAAGIAALARRSRAAWISAAVGAALVFCAPRFAEAKPRWDGELQYWRCIAWIRASENSKTVSEKQLALRQAWIAFDRGIALAPEDPRLWLSSGYLQMHGDDGTLRGDGANYDDAIARTTRALELRPDYVEALRNRAELWLRVGRADLAVADLERLLQELPWSEVDRKYLAEARWRAAGGH